MRLLILAGGFGTRLKTALGDIPKALAPVANIPFLQLQLQHWINQGIKEFSFLLHHQSDQIILFLQAQSLGMLKNCHVDWIIEPAPMDTGGAVANAVRELELEGHFLVTNADTWLGSGMVELMRSSSPSIAVIHLNDISRYGQVEFDHGLCITRFAEKSGLSISGWINAGLFHLDSSFFENWDGKPFSLERTLFLKLVKDNRMKAVPLKTDFLDIGVPQDYNRFCGWIESGCKVPL